MFVPKAARLGGHFRNTAFPLSALSKNADAPYRSDCNEAWLKVKCVQKGKFPVIGFVKDPAGRGSGNSRNGTSAKTLLTEDGEIDIAVPRDRAGSFEPLLIAKGQTRFDGFDDKILSLYARGMTVREIQGHLSEIIAKRILAALEDAGLQITLVDQS